MAASDLSFDSLAGDDDDESVGLAPVHYLELEGSNPADLVADEDHQALVLEKLGTALGELDERSRDIIQQRWLSDGKSTLHELADKYQVSAERIRQIEKNAMNKLKAAMAA
jgi:RNA polymerase sigma-32 factor